MASKPAISPLALEPLNWRFFVFPEAEVRILVLHIPQKNVPDPGELLVKSLCDLQPHVHDL
jgi:hypothetical protein